MAWHSTWNEPPPRRRTWLLGAGGFTPPGVRLVLIATIAVFVVDALFFRGGLSAYGAVSVRSLMRLEVWRMITFQFLHANLEHILWNMFILWMLGVTLERQLGTRQFLYLYFISGAVGGLFEVVFNATWAALYGDIVIRMRVPGGYQLAGMSPLDMPAVGASAGVAGVLVAFAVLNPRTLFYIFFLLPVQARWVALVYCLAETRYVVLGLMGRWSGGVAHAAHFGGMLVGFLWAWFGPRLWSWWRSRPGGRRAGGPTSGPPGPEREEADQAEVDRILAKIHQEGIGSLSTREKLFLQEVSRRNHEGR